MRPDLSTAPPLNGYEFASSALSPVLTIMDDIITLTVYFPDVTYDRIQEHTETEFNVAEQLAVMKGMG